MKYGFEVIEMEDYSQHYGTEVIARKIYSNFSFLYSKQTIETHRPRYWPEDLFSFLEYFTLERLVINDIITTQQPWDWNEPIVLDM